MTENSPWGQPPADNSYGPPPGVYPPASGPTQPPGNWGAPPPTYGGGPQGPYGPPPPRKSNTAAIIAVVTGIVVVVAAVVVTLVVKSGGNDNQDAKDPISTVPSSSTTSSSETPETPETPETSSTPETSTPGPGKVPAGAIEGTRGGYYFELPGPAWNDAYEEASQRDLGPTLDSFIVLGKNIALSQSNILTEALSAGGAAVPEDLEEQWKRNLSGADGAVPVDVDDITVDGEHAIGVKFVERVNASKVKFNQRAYLCLHNGQQYSILLSYPSSGDFVSEDDFDTMLASWKWID